MRWIQRKWWEGGKWELLPGGGVASSSFAAASCRSLFAVTIRAVTGAALSPPLSSGADSVPPIPAGLYLGPIVRQSGTTSPHRRALV